MLNANRAIVYTLSAVILLSLLSACGFQRRGEVELPTEMRATYLKGQVPEALRNELVYLFESADGKIVDSVEDASAILNLQKVRFNRRILSVSERGRQLEYELSYRVTFDVSTPQGEPLVKPQTVGIVRSYLNPETEVLGRSEEEAGLRRDMEQDLARQIAVRSYAQIRGGL